MFAGRFTSRFTPILASSRLSLAPSAVPFASTSISHSAYRRFPLRNFATSYPPSPPPPTSNTEGNHSPNAVPVSSTSNPEPNRHPDSTIKVSEKLKDAYSELKEKLHNTTETIVAGGKRVVETGKRVVESGKDAVNSGKEYVAEKEQEWNQKLEEIEEKFEEKIEEKFEKFEENSEAASMANQPETVIVTEIDATVRLDPVDSGRVSSIRDEANGDAEVVGSESNHQPSVNHREGTTSDTMLGTQAIDEQTRQRQRQAQPRQAQPTTPTRRSNPSNITSEK